MQTWLGHEARPGLGEPAAARLRRGSLAQREAVRDIFARLEGHTFSAEEVAAAGGIPALVSLLQSSGNCVSQQSAADVLASLAFDSPERSAAIAAAGGIPALVHLLGRGEEDVASSATRALAVLAQRGHCSSRRRACIAAPCGR